MIGDFITGVSYLGRGFRLLAQPGIRRFALAPIIVNVMVFGALIWFGGAWFDTLMTWLLPASDDWWVALARGALWLFFAAAVAVALFFGFTVVANLIGAPFNGLLAESVEVCLGGGAAPAMSWRRLWREVGPMALNEVRKIAYHLSRALPAGLLFLIPVVQLAAPAVWAVLGAWLLCLQYVDFPMANHGYRFTQVRQRLGRHRSLALGFGAAVAVVSLVPVANLLVMPAAVAGATALWVDQFSQE